MSHRCQALKWLLIGKFKGLIYSDILFIWFGFHASPRRQNLLLSHFIDEQSEAQGDLMICLIQGQTDGQWEQWNSKAVLLYHMVFWWGSVQLASFAFGSYPSCFWQQGGVIGQAPEQAVRRGLAISIMNAGSFWRQSCALGHSFCSCKMEKVTTIPPTQGSCKVSMNYYVPRSWHSVWRRVTS